MPDTGGFAVALTIRERPLNDYMLYAYTNGDFSRTIDLALPDAPPTCSIQSLYIVSPQLHCNADGTLTIGVEGWGSLSVAMAGEAQQTRRVHATIMLLIEPAFAVQQDKLVLRFDEPNDLGVSEVDLTVISGGAFSPDADAYLRSDDFRANVEHAIRNQLSLAQLKVDASFLGGLSQAVNAMEAKVRIVQGAILLGFDITYPLGSTELDITGDVDLLVDFAGSNDLAAAIHPLAAPVFLLDAWQKVNDEIQKSGASLESLTITADQGRFHIAGKASKSTGEASFQFDLVPMMFASRPGIVFQDMPKPLHVNAKTWPAFSFAVANVSVDTEAALLVDAIAGILVLFGGTVYVGNYLQDLADNLAGEIAGGGKSPVPRVWRLNPKRSQPGAIGARIAMDEFAVNAGGVFVGGSVRLKPPRATIVGLTSIPADLQGATLSYSLQLPPGVLADDPALYVSWMVTDLTSGLVLSHEGGKAADWQTLSFAPAGLGSNLTQLAIRCRAYRALGAAITDFLNDELTLRIRGPLPVGAYVRWSYEVSNPQVRWYDQNGTWAYQGAARVKRHSNWHRTDRPCAMTARRSHWTEQTETIDTLPFAIDRIALHREELCDYCFYGGPGGIRPAL